MILHRLSTFLSASSGKFPDSSAKHPAETLQGRLARTKNLPAHRKTGPERTRCLTVFSAKIFAVRLSFPCTEANEFASANR
jgi:hypothetical protein